MFEPSGRLVKRADAGARSLATGLVDELTARIRGGAWRPGARLPTEGQLGAEFGVSRTVVREALSRLQAAGLTHTRHGVGSFVAERGTTAVFRLGARPLQTLHDVVAVLELRIAVETEAAGLAAQRRTAANLEAMRAALDDMAQALAAGTDAVQADFRFHSEIARATQNTHFSNLMATLGVRSIPRARVEAGAPVDEARLAWLRRLEAEHTSLYDAIAAGDADAARAAMRTHLVNSRERRRRAAVV